MARAARARRTALAAVGVLALAGCTVPSNSPAAYDDDIEEFFVEGCTGDVPEADGTTTTLASSGDCECAYGVFVDMVPYDDDARQELTEGGDLRYAGYPEGAPTFEDLDSDPTDGETGWDSLPADVREALDACAGAGSAGGGGDEGTDGTTPSTEGEPSDATDDTTG